MQEEPVAPSNFSSRLLDYACSFRLIRIWIRLLSPFVYYAEVAITIALMYLSFILFFNFKIVLRLKQWLLSAPKCGLFLIQQLCRFADALLLGVEESSFVRSSESDSSWKYPKNKKLSTKNKQKVSLFSFLINKSYSS